VHIFAGILRHRQSSTSGVGDHRGRLICRSSGTDLLAESNSIWQAYLGYAVLGGIGSRMVYSSCINAWPMVSGEKGLAARLRERRLAYGAVPSSSVIGGNKRRAINMTPSQIKTYILWQGLIITVASHRRLVQRTRPRTGGRRRFDTLNWQKHITRDLRSNPPARSALQPLGDVAHPAQASGSWIQYGPVFNRLLPVRCGLLLPRSPRP